MFCFFRHDIRDDVNKREGVKLYRLLLDGSLGKEKEVGTEKERRRHGRIVRWERKLWTTGKVELGLRTYINFVVS